MLDAVLFDQVLDNLLDNALKFSQPGSNVTLQAIVAASAVLVSVTDGGVGIPADQQGHIFDPFFRSRRGDAAPAGTGLGLTICRAVLAAMGARIMVESPVQGVQGTRFTLALPR